MQRTDLLPKICVTLTLTFQGHSNSTAMGAVGVPIHDFVLFFLFNSRPSIWPNWSALPDTSI